MTTENIILVQPVINTAVRALCTNTYHGHKNGCPNYGKRETCPPAAPLFKQVIDLTKPVYAIFNKFPFGVHVEKMRAKHPGWSDRQAGCCLYWQGTARKQLRGRIAEFSKDHPDYIVFQVPEALGVDVTATMKDVGHELEWSPKIWTYQVALAGLRLE